MKNGLIIDELGNKRWYVENKLHRDNDLPAVECTDGDRLWYVEGKLHRDNDLPAIEDSYGDKYWYVDDKRHRESGPAVVRNNGTYFEYWINGEQIEDIPTDKLLTKEQLEIHITFM